MNQFVSKWLFSTNHKDIHKRLSGLSHLNYFEILFSVLYLLLQFILFVFSIVAISFVMDGFRGFDYQSLALRQILLLFFFVGGFIAYFMVRKLDVDLFDRLLSIKLPRSEVGLAHIAYVFPKMRGVYDRLIVLLDNSTRLRVYNLIKIFFFFIFKGVSMTLYVLIVMGYLPVFLLKFCVCVSFGCWLINNFIKSFEIFVDWRDSDYTGLLDLNLEKGTSIDRVTTTAVFSIKEGANSQENEQLCVNTVLKDWMMLARVSRGHLEFEKNLEVSRGLTTKYIVLCRLFLCYWLLQVI